MITNPLKYLFGLSYLLKTFFPVYWNESYHYYTGNQGTALFNQEVGATLFLTDLQICLITAAMIVAFVYIITVIGIKGEFSLPQKQKREELKVTSIFAILEAVFLYYGSGLLLVGYRPGKILYGFPHAPYLGIFPTPFQPFPGLGNIVWTLFPSYVVFDILGADAVIPPPVLSSQVAGATQFLLVFWTGLITAAVVTAIVYTIRFKGIRRKSTRVPPLQETQELML
jgi:hypothetical protein